MNAYVAATDPGWFHFLADLHEVDEVNFWYPTPWGGRFRVLADGQPLLFKLKQPHDALAGGGFFKHYTELPLSIAWEAFGEKNGAPTHLEVWRSIKRLRREVPRPGDDPTIGCVLLVEPFFWPEEHWIREVPGWHPNIQRGRRYDLREGDGVLLWEAVMERLRAHVGADRGKETASSEPWGGYSDPLRTPRRIGQGTFQALVTDIYRRQCAVTREKALPTLDAAHIRPFSSVREHTVTNGILLRSDVHRLFDAGYVTITPELRVEASRRLRDDFDDGESYLQLHGKPVWAPSEAAVRPDAAALAWHNEEVFRG